MRSVALAFVLVLAACGGAHGWGAFAGRDGAAADDGGGDSASDDAGSSSGGGDDVIAPVGCVASSCKACILGTPSCSDAGACQCCAAGICL